MRIVDAFDARIERFIALRGGWLATYRVHIAGLGGLVAEIDAVTKQTISIWRQTGAARAIGIHGTILPNARPSRAYPLATARNVAVVVSTLAEKITNTGPAEVRCGIAVRVRGARSPRVRGRR